MSAFAKVVADEARITFPIIRKELFLNGMPAYAKAAADDAFVAELVDALVSNTSNFTVVSVRVRPEVLNRKTPDFQAFFCSSSHNNLIK